MTSKTYRPLPVRLVALAAILLALAFAGSTAVPKATAAPPPEFYGLSVSDPGSNNQFAWNRIASSGAKTVRVEFNWQRDFYGGGSAASCPSSPLPSSGFSWSAIDSKVRWAGVRGITILPYLTGSFCSNGYPEPGSAEMTAWKTFAGDLATRYGPGGTYWAGNWDGLGGTTPAKPIGKWEIGDEPNLAENNPSKVLDAQKYGKFLIETSGSIKAAQPAAKTLIGGLDYNANLSTWLGNLYSPNPSSPCCAYTASQLHSAYDGVGLHPYAVTGNATSVTNAITASRTTLNSVTSPHGAAKPISITEVGWPVGNSVISKCASTSTANHNGYAQANNLRLLYNWLVANYTTYDLDMGVWNSDNDTNAKCGSGGSVAAGNAGQVYSRGKMGLFETHIWSKRPAFCEYIKFTGATTNCPQNVHLLSSPGMDYDDDTAQIVTAYVNVTNGITVYDGTIGEDLTPTSVPYGQTPGVSIDPTTGAAKVVYRTSDGRMGIWERSSLGGSWTHSVRLAAGSIRGSTSIGVHRAGDSGSGTLITTMVWSDANDDLYFMADTALGWFGPTKLGTGVSSGTTPSISRDVGTGTMNIAFRNTNGQVGMWTWTSVWGWTSSVHGAANSVKASTSPDVDRDHVNGKTVIAYHNNSDVLAAHTLMPGAWVWGSASSGTTMASSADPIVAIDQVRSTAAVAFTNSSTDGISMWRMGSGGTWTSPSAIPSIRAGSGTNPALVLGSDPSQEEVLMTFTDGRNTALAQRLAFQTALNWSWDSPIYP